ncbi:hypothetical protein NUSPORA_00394 [Nucleospora cyclopteri]
MNRKYAITFDLNDTLVERIFKEHIPLEEHKKYTDYDTIGYHFVRTKPGIELIKPYLKNKNCFIILWSKMEKRNLINYEKYLEEKHGLKFDLVLDTSHCSKGEDHEKMNGLSYKKDLKTVADLLKIEIDNIILIDDHKEKSVGNQNFYHISDETNGIKAALEFLERSFFKN